jgi:hypothetical protein
MNIKYAFQILKNFEKFKEAIDMNTEFNKNMEFTKEQENFKESLVNIELHEYPEKYEHYLYNKAKAELYNIDWDYDDYDPIGLAQAIDQYEWSKRKHQYNNDKEYYDNLGVR